MFKPRLLLHLHTPGQSRSDKWIQMYIHTLFDIFQVSYGEMVGCDNTDVSFMFVSVCVVDDVWVLYDQIYYYCWYCDLLLCINEMYIKWKYQILEEENHLNFLFLIFSSGTCLVSLFAHIL